MAEHRYIAFYDLDHTILEENSATYLVRESLKRGIMTRRDYRRALWFSILYKLHLGDPARMIERMLYWLKGKDEAEMEQFGRDIFLESLVHIFRPEILKSIEEHRDKGAAIVLLSSAPKPICEPVQEHMQLDGLICTELESVDGKYTGHPSRKLVYDREKEVRMLEYCREHDQDPADAWYYGDSYTDQHVMRAVGHAIAVAPDSRLKKIAEAENWPVLAEKK